MKNAYLNGCRSFIGVDRFHLKGKYGGVLLAVVGMDTNSGIVHRKMAICAVRLRIQRHKDSL